ncbi:molybdenum cofactor guanylyltransferase [Rosenbergiella sp. S61]|uniref:Molybdenum cofactor guanylyltransferase n=1 Tax=Rosenbergiella gaditana TaxID=2726987 RepID=A0ABS5SUN2_9GAMM|nr:molybdenum cofactor guanylyltransferase [Rosenbergiella gaditana]
MISGIILAGGAGRRMKGKDKGLVLWHKKALIDHVIENFSPQVTCLVVNANRNIALYQQRGFPVIQDKALQLLGPLAGIDVGLEAIQTEWLAVAPCDSPLFPSDYVQRLYDFAQCNKLALTWVHQNGQDHPLFCLIHRELQEALNDFLYQQGRRKVLDFFNSHGRAMIFSEDVPHFANFNDEESLK